jgi:fused signal recognition particle receptor
VSDIGGGGWLGRLRAGLGRSSSKIAGGIRDLFVKRKLDRASLDDLEALLIGADLGVTTAAKLTAALAKDRFEKEVSPQEVQSVLADQIAQILSPYAKPLAIDPGKKPFVVLVCGVNGSGKTTTIAKLAKMFSDQKRKTLLVAGDTFRAAAIEQLQVWGQRIGAPVIAGQQGSDAASLAFDALDRARKESADVLLIDTAGRLHNKADLMAELGKIVRVLRKLDASAPHACLLVLDATVGQNAHAQVEAFKEMTQVTGLIMTKLDGTARGGVVVALAEKFGLPIHAVGVGEGMDDLRPFEAQAFARGLMGLPD